MALCSKFINIGEVKNPDFELKPRQDLCVHRFGEYCKTNGILLLHNVGSGKTITSLTLAINMIDWKTPARKRIIMYVHPTGLYSEISSDINKNILGVTYSNECSQNISGVGKDYVYNKVSKNEKGKKASNQLLFTIQSVEYRDLNVLFSKYDTSKDKIKELFLNKIVIIDEAHRLFRQFDICDPKSMLIDKYINDQLLIGAKNIIFMTGTPIKNDIKDIFKIYKCINICNQSNIISNNISFDLSDITTFRHFTKPRIKTINPTIMNQINCSWFRFGLLVNDFWNRDKTNYHPKIENLEIGYLKAMSEIQQENKYTDHIVTYYQLLKTSINCIFGENQTVIGTSIVERDKKILDIINKVIKKVDTEENYSNFSNFSFPPETYFGPMGGSKRNKNKTKKNKKGGAPMTIGEAKKILEIDETITNEEEIEQLAKTNYRKFAREYHPDRNAAPSAVEYFKKINEAYHTIIGKIQFEETSETQMNEENINDNNDISELLSIASNLSMTNAFLDMEDSEVELCIYKILKVFLSDEYQNKFKKIGFKKLIIELLTTDSEDYIKLNSQAIMNLKDLSYTEIINIINFDNGNSDYLLEYYYSENIKLYNKIINPNKSIEGISSSNPVDSEENLEEISSSNPVNSEESRSVEELSSSNTVNSEEKLEEIPATSNSDSYPDNYGSFHEPQESEYSSIKDWFTGKRNEKWLNSGGGLEDIEILDDISINKFIYEINKLSDKPKNLDTSNKIKSLMGEATPEIKEKIMKNMDKIKQITSDIKNSTLELTLKIDNIIKQLEIENQKLEIENQKGGMPGLLVAVMGPTSLLIKLNVALKLLGTSCGDLPELMIAGLNSILPETFNIPLDSIFVTGITKLVKAVENPFTFGWQILVEKVGYNVILEYAIKLKTGLSSIIKYLKGIPLMFINFIIAVCSCLCSHWVLTISLLSLIIFIKSKYYKRGVSIWKLDRKTWMTSIYLYWTKKIVSIRRNIRLFKSTPDNLEIFLSAKQNGWQRKQYKLKVELDETNVFNKINFESFCQVAKIYTSTITFNMKQINTNLYKKLLNTNLYIFKSISSKDLLFDNSINKFYYPKKNNQIIYIYYDTYQKYVYNIIKTILDNVYEHNEITNNFLPWFINYKKILKYKLIGNFSEDISYPLNTFIDMTKPIVVFNPTKGSGEYEINVSQDKITSSLLTLDIYTTPDRSENKKLYSGVINCKCDKFEKILKNLLLMKTGYMYDNTNGENEMTPQPHVCDTKITKENIDDSKNNGSLYKSVHNINDQSSQYFLPFVYSSSDELGLNLFAQFLNQKGLKYLVLHESTADETEVKKLAIDTTYSIINMEDPSKKKELSQFFLENIVHDFDNVEFFKKYYLKFISEPICVLLHPLKTEGINAKYTPAIFLLEPVNNFGDYEQLCGRVLRLYSNSCNYVKEPQKMIYQTLCSTENTLMELYKKNQSVDTKFLLKEEIYSLRDFFIIKQDVTLLDLYGNELEAGTHNKLNPFYVPIAVSRYISPVEIPFTHYPAKFDELLIGNDSLLSALYSDLSDKLVRQTIDISRYLLDQSYLEDLKQQLEIIESIIHDLVNKDPLLLNRLSSFLEKSFEPLQIITAIKKLQQNLEGFANVERKNIRPLEIKTSKQFFFTSKYDTIRELIYKTDKFIYANLILKNMLLYINAFRIDKAQYNYNITFLIELLSYNNFIGDISNYDNDICIMNEEINLFKKIKVDEYNFKEKFIKNIQGDDNSIVDLNEIIDCNSKTINSVHQEFMPWCDTISDFNFNKCNVLYETPYDFTEEQITQIKNISDDIIRIVEMNPDDNVELNIRKDDLNKLYQSLFHSTEPPESVDILEEDSAKEASRFLVDPNYKPKPNPNPNPNSYPEDIIIKPIEGTTPLEKIDHSKIVVPPFNDPVLSEGRGEVLKKKKRSSRSKNTKAGAPVKTTTLKRR